MYGKLPGLEMCAGNSISWHLLGMGIKTGVHTAFFHGQALTVRHQRTDVVSLFPATFVTAEMVPRNIGKWLLSCNEHLPGKESSFISLVLLMPINKTFIVWILRTVIFGVQVVCRDNYQAQYKTRVLSEEKSRPVFKSNSAAYLKRHFIDTHADTHPCTQKR